MSIVRGNDRVSVLRRLDLGARGALLSAGLLAQWAMWIDAPAWVYPVAAVALIGLSVESARRPFVAPAGARFGAGSRRRQRYAYRIVGCVAMVEVCVALVGSLPFEGAVPMALPVGVLLLAVQGAQLQTIRSRRDAVIGLLVVVVMLADAGFFARDAKPVVAVLPAVVMLMIAAALLQRGSVLAGTRAAIGLPRAPVLRTLFGPAATALVIGAIVFLAMPNSVQLGTRNTLRHVALAASGGQTATAGRASLDPGVASLDLRVRGTLSDQPVFAVAADSPPYWQGTVFDTFDGTSWTATGAPAQPVTGTSAQPVTGTEPVRTDVVQVLSPSGLGVVMAPGEPTAYNGPGQMTVGADGTAVLTGAGASSPWNYQVTSASPAADPTTLRAATGSDSLDPKWTAVEPGLPARVRDLAAQLTASTTTRYDAVNAVDGYLQTHEVYDLTSPLPAHGEDAVDDFLFVSHRGFCEQFASAAVILLRSTGIPARLVTGYSKGDLTSAPGERIMRGSDAHAWIQVWYPGVGWVNSDPTAAAVLPPAAPTQAKTTTAPNTAEAARHPLPLTGALRIMPGGRLGWLIALVSLLAIGFCAVLVIAGLRRRRPIVLEAVGGHEPRPGDGPVLQAYVRLDAALGGQARDPEQTMREVAHHLEAAGCSYSELASALDCLERECYATSSPEPAQVRAAVDVFDRLRRSLSLTGAITP